MFYLDLQCHKTYTACSLYFCPLTATHSWVSTTYQEFEARQTACQEQKASPVHRQTWENRNKACKWFKVTSLHRKIDLWSSPAPGGEGKGGLNLSLTATTRTGSLPECDDDGRGLGTGGDKSDDEEEDEERYECVAGAVTFPRHRVAILVQVSFDDD